MPYFKLIIPHSELIITHSPGEQALSIQKNVQDIQQAIKHVNTEISKEKEALSLRLMESNDDFHQNESLEKRNQILSFQHMILKEMQLLCASLDFSQTLLHNNVNHVELFFAHIKKKIIHDHMEKFYASHATGMLTIDSVYQAERYRMNMDQYISDIVAQVQYHMTPTASSDAFPVNVWIASQKKISDHEETIYPKHVPITLDEVPIWPRIDVHHMNQMISLRHQGVSSPFGIIQTEKLLDMTHRHTWPSFSEILYRFYVAAVLSTPEQGITFRFPILEESEEAQGLMDTSSHRVSWLLDKKNREFFYDFLKAIFMMSARFPSIRCLCPAVTSLNEFIAMRRQIDLAKKILSAYGMKANSTQLKMGVMLEAKDIASTKRLHALMHHADFFSMNINDVISSIQGIKKHAVRDIHLLHPTVLLTLKMIADTALKQKKSVEIQGQIGATEIGSAVLLGLGFSHIHIHPSDERHFVRHIEKFILSDLTVFIENLLKKIQSSDMEGLEHNAFEIEIISDAMSMISRLHDHSVQFQDTLERIIHELNQAKMRPKTLETERGIIQKAMAPLVHITKIDRELFIMPDELKSDMQSISSKTKEPVINTQQVLLHPESGHVLGIYHYQTQSMTWFMHPLDVSKHSPSLMIPAYHFMMDSLPHPLSYFKYAMIHLTTLLQVAFPEAMEFAHFIGSHDASSHLMIAEHVKVLVEGGIHDDTIERMIDLIKQPEFEKMQVNIRNTQTDRAFNVKFSMEGFLARQGDDIDIIITGSNMKTKQKLLIQLMAILHNN